MNHLRSSLLPTVILGSAILGMCTKSSAADEVPELSKDDGPYMVMACSVRGPEAELIARTVAKELRREHELPAFLYQATGKNGLPEFAVLVGNGKSPREALELCKRVKKIKPNCLKDAPNLIRGNGLGRALTITNPLARID